MDEFYLLMNVHFSSTIKVVGLVTSVGGPMMMIMEFLEKGDLKSYVQENGRDMTEDQLTSICENVSQLMSITLSIYLS